MRWLPLTLALFLVQVPAIAQTWMAPGPPAFLVPAAPQVPLPGYGAAPAGLAGSRQRAVPNSLTGAGSFALPLNTQASPLTIYAVEGLIGRLVSHLSPPAAPAATNPARHAANAQDAVQ